MNLGQILDFKMPGNFTRSIQKTLNPEVNPEMFLNKLSTSFIGRLLMNCSKNQKPHHKTGDDGTTENTAAPPQHESQ